MIGNPPYIQLSKIENISDDYKRYLKKRYNTSAGRLNTFIFFIHQGLEILCTKGILTFIIPNTILTQEYYTYTREQILKKHQLLEIVNYENMPFENAVVENVTIFIQSEIEEKKKIKIKVDDLSTAKFIYEKTNDDFLNQDNYSFSFNSNSIIDSVFQLDNIQTVGDLCHVNQAIALKGDKTLSLHNRNDNDKYYKVLDGRNIDKFEIKWTGVFLDYSLDRIHSCKRKDIFESQEKLFFRRVSENLVFTYDNEQYFALNTLIAVNLKVSPNTVMVKYLLAILNSSLMNYIYKGKFKSTKKVFSEIQANTIEKLPIKIIDNFTQKQLVDLVDKIIEAKKLSMDTKKMEEKIDSLVYKIYDFTFEQVKIMDPNFWLNKDEYTAITI